MPLPYPVGTWVITDNTPDVPGGVGGGNAKPVVITTPGDASVIVESKGRGPQGPAGPAGAGADLNVQFSQGLAATTWGPFVHGLGKNPSVTVVDSGGNVIEGSVTYPSDKVSVQIDFSFPLGGEVYLN